MSSNGRFWATVVFIGIITLIAIWIDLPGNRQFQFQVGPFALPSREIKVFEGLDLQGGLQVLLQAKTPDGTPPAKEDLEATRFIIENRVNGLGVSEPVIQIQGNDKIVVELPGLSDPDAAIAAFGQTGRLEFVDAGDTILPPGTKVSTTYPNLWQAGQEQPAAGADGQPTFATVIAGEHLRSAEMQFDSRTRAPIVTFQTSPEGARRLSEYTAKNIGKIMPIVLDGAVISSPRVNAVISDAGQIEGNFTQQEASALALQLKYGALKVPLDVVNTRTVGPTLGQDSVRRSILAGIVGLTAVALFMIIYYRLPGVLATVALLIYGLITLALFKVIPVTLTLPGIAGFVLSIGMAVDANILIFERMREELRGGRPLRVAVETGFQRAWPSIRDSNISTLITCVILFWFGSQFGASVVKGFAVTLSLGVLVSMFTAIVVTRTLLRLTRRLWDLDESTAAASGHLHTLFGY
ncbi:MAG: protein translocase subunit SecD [Anaerolineae bacterium]|nr:protein translocase subunit SecD [Anaerolineae bacterium]